MAKCFTALIKSIIQKFLLLMLILIHGKYTCKRKKKTSLRGEKGSGGRRESRGGWGGVGRRGGRVELGEV